MPDQPRITKYGMPASESQRYEASHLVVMQERKRIDELRFARSLQALPSLRAALDRLAAMAETAPPPFLAQLQHAIADRRIQRSPDDLRAALGLR